MSAKFAGYNPAYSVKNSFKVRLINLCIDNQILSGTNFGPVYYMIGADPFVYTWPDFLMKRPMCSGISYTLSSYPPGLTINSALKQITVQTVATTVPNTYLITLFGTLTVGTITTTGSYVFTLRFISNAVSYITPVFIDDV